MSVGSEIWYDSASPDGPIVINESALPIDEIRAAALQQHPEVALLTRWSSNMTTNRTRRGNIFQRDRYLTPHNIFDQMKVALDAAETDDIVSGVLESTESLAFNRVSMGCDDEQQEDVWNQIIDDLEIDKMLRQMWRESFITSQFYCGVLWGKKTYKARTKTSNGNKSKKVFKDLRVPIALSILDPLRIIPVGSFLFGQERLAYIANPTEATTFDQVLAGTNTSDLVVSQLIDQRYVPNWNERRWIQEMTGARNLDHLFLFKQGSVFRHTATRPDYMRFAGVRLKSVFELLDLKQQLREMDRAYLLGATNFIILVKKGSDELPAKQAEVNTLSNQMQNLSRFPVIVNDHRTEIQIITPEMDITLDPQKYNVLDSRITARLYLMFMTGGFSAGAGGDDSIKLARVIARGMESRRFMIFKTLHKEIFRPTFDRNETLDDPVTMNFHPKRIALDFDPNFANYMQDLRDRGDVSRDTLLAEVDLDEAQEAVLRIREAEQYDDVFTPVNIEFQGQVSVKETAEPGPTAPKAGSKDDAPVPGAAPAAPPPGAPKHSVTVDPKGGVKVSPAQPVGGPAAKKAPAKKAAGTRRTAQSPTKGPVAKTPATKLAQRTAGRRKGGANPQSGATGPGRGPAKAAPKPSARNKRAAKSVASENVDDTGSIS